MLQEVVSDVNFLKPNKFSWKGANAHTISHLKYELQILHQSGLLGKSSDLHHHYINLGCWSGKHEDKFTVDLIDSGT